MCQWISWILLIVMYDGHLLILQHPTEVPETATIQESKVQKKDIKGLMGFFAQQCQNGNKHEVASVLGMVDVSGSFEFDAQMWLQSL